uniref:RING-type domain-containing protein n=1 Tax=Acrobeloides nanus TaxID=290746 RepID=A0A914D4X1_9BILA
MYRWVLFDEFPFNINLDDEMDQHFRNFMQTRPMVRPRRMSRYVVEPRTIVANSTTTSNEPSKRTQKSDKEPICCICLIKKVEMVLIPCGHYKYCEKCAENIKTCSICRTKIIGRQKVYA